MKQIILALLLTTPAMAETPAPSDADKGFSLMQEGANLLMNHVFDQVDPKLQEFASALEQAQPQLMQLLAAIDDVKNFHAPEILPNGDILIRRKTPAELKLEELPGDQTDL